MTHFFSGFEVGAEVFSVLLEVEFEPDVVEGKEEEEEEEEAYREERRRAVEERAEGRRMRGVRLRSTDRRGSILGRLAT